MPDVYHDQNMCRPTKKESVEISRIRGQINGLPVVNEDEAKAAGGRQVTDTYYTKFLGQCEMLLRAVEGETPARLLLVKTERGIAIWRRPL